jgi:nitrite reductase/ring-hydroxylating ferredoxin subunit
MTEILEKKLSRRTLLRVGGCAGLTVTVCGATGVILDSQTDILDRLRGVSKTPLLENDAAWDYTGSTLTLALNLVPDLAEPGGAVRLENDQVPEPLLIVHGEDGNYHVYVNKCPHAKRKIDPAGGKLECTSIGQSTFDYDGTVLSGPAKSSLTTYVVELKGDQLLISLA